MKAFVLAATLMICSQAAFADNVVARSVRRGDTVVTTTDRGIYTTQIQRNPTGSTSETRFHRTTPPSFAERNRFNGMSH
jgi:hypothetical protein